MVVLSYLSLILSLILSFSVILLRYYQYFKSYKIKLVHFLHQPFINILLLLSLFIFRYISSVPKSLFYTFIFANVSIICSFYLSRIFFITQVYVYNNYTFVIFFVLFFLALFFGIMRLFFRIGFLLNTYILENPTLIPVLEHVAKSTFGTFTLLGKKLVGNMPPNPGTKGVDRNFVLGVATFVATSVAAGGGLYLGYQAMQTSSRSADIAERGLDILERNSGKMSEEVFNAKWDEFGNKRK